MEMQDISTENKGKSEDEGKIEDKGASEPKQEETKEEAETEHYSELRSPSEDVYSEAFYNEPPQKIRKGTKKDEGSVPLYRAVCIFLVAVCLVFLLVIIVLGVKLQTGSTVCPEREEASGTDRDISPPTCDLKECQRQFPEIRSKRLGCRQCADGWLTHGRSCFYLSTVRLTWSKSQLNCTASGGSLAIITDKNIQDFLTKKGNLKYWIGLRQNDNRWNWSNNNDLQTSYWADDQTNGDCAFLNSEGPSEKNWVRANCQAATYFICQLQM